MAKFNIDNKLVIIGSAAAVSGLVIGAVWYRKYLKSLPPKKWMKVGEVESLCMYPVKSFKGVQLDHFECTPLGARSGFIRDRSFVVITDEGKVITGRDYPLTTQLLVEISGTKVILKKPDDPEEIELSVEDINGELRKITIWETAAEGIDCGDKAAQWVSKRILGTDSGLRVLFCGLKDEGKTVNARITEFSRRKGTLVQRLDGGFFSDGVSYHLISQASIKELNSRLDGTQVSAMNFRPNFIIKGDCLTPFEEDSWKWVKIGNVVFQYLAPCTRCVFTTIDPNTGVKNQKTEPLATLRKYRIVREEELRNLLSSPVMGVYLGARTLGNVSVGDEVFLPCER